MSILQKKTREKKILNIFFQQKGLSLKISISGKKTCLPFFYARVINIISLDHLVFQL